MLGNILHLAEGVALGTLASSPSLSGDALKAAITKSLQDAATQQAERVHKGLGAVVATLFALPITRHLIDRAVDDALGKAGGLLASLPFQATAPVAQPNSVTAPPAHTGGTQPLQGTGAAPGAARPTAPAPQGLAAQAPAAPKPAGQGQAT